MKKAILFLSLSASLLSFSQQAGDIYATEKKLDLTPEQVLQSLGNLVGQPVSQDVLNLLTTYSIGLQAYKITYYTPNYNGQLVKATGLVMYPKVNFQLSTILYNHPTTDSRNNVPSNLKDVATVGFALPLTYALSGYIVVAPDYLGMGSGDGKHPYVNAKTEASASIDMMKAANKFLATTYVKRYDENFMTGYSQGGHATMSVLKANYEKYNNLYKFRYVYSGAGPYDMSDTTLNKGVIQKTTYPNSAFLAYVINSCHNIGYKQYVSSPNEIIADNYQQLYQDRVINEGGGLFWGPIIWKNLFKDSYVQALTSNNNHPLRQCLRESDVYNWYNKTPMTMQYTSLDMTIPPANSTKALNVQRSFYPWWDLSKYNLETADLGLFEHDLGSIPYLLASVYKFNTLRSGGFFNWTAMLTSKQISENEKSKIDISKSRISPEFKIDGKDIDAKNLIIKSVKNDKTSKVETTDFKNLKKGVYIIELDNNGEKIAFPYVKQEAVSVEEKELIKFNENNSWLVNLKGLQEVSEVNVFDIQNNKVKSIDLNYENNTEINIDNSDLQEGNYTIEVVTNFTSLKTNTSKKISPSSNNSLAIISENNQIQILAKDVIAAVEIYDMSGNQVKNISGINSNRTNISLSQKGIYLVKVTYGNGKSEVKKVVK